MDDNINREDINKVVQFLSADQIPKLTNGPKVVEFEKKWSKWLGVEYSLMVNSGSAANELTFLAMKYIWGGGEIIVPPLTWISDISAVLFAGYTPVFCDINLKNLSFNIEELKKCITHKTRAIFITHVLGINGLTDKLLNICYKNGIMLIEDVCESHGAKFKDKKVGTFGLASNFSFYFGHHMTTIEGGMISTNDEHFYQICRALRSHGMVREITNEKTKQNIIDKYKDLHSDFIFIRPSHNFRSSEINAVFGLSQIERLNTNNNKRVDNFNYFLRHLNSEKYFTEFNLEGHSNYALIIILKQSSIEIRNKIEKMFNDNDIDYRRGLSGGGNQMKQPYMLDNYVVDHNEFKTINHIHDFSWYVGNYPNLERDKIDKLLKLINEI